MHHTPMCLCGSELLTLATNMSNVVRKFRWKTIDLAPTMALFYMYTSRVNSACYRYKGGREGGREGHAYLKVIFSTGNSKC